MIAKNLGDRRIKMKRFVLERKHTDGKGFCIDITDYSFMEFINLIREKAKLGGVMAIINDDIRLMIDNKRFFGNIRYEEEEKRQCE